MFDVKSDKVAFQKRWKQTSGVRLTLLSFIYAIVCVYPFFGQILNIFNYSKPLIALI